tara:strand:+ start:784 stop:1017 length:234 start_codon:yes stop_codon:yes gene_type:complete
MSWLLTKHWTLKIWVLTKTYWCAGVWLIASYFLYKLFLYKKEEETFSQTIERKLKAVDEEIKMLEQQHYEEQCELEE